MSTETVLRAKPTLYKDIWFRSRLEASFAQWLDVQEVPWIYEPDVLLGQQKYQPDFSCPFGYYSKFIEIKPMVFAREAQLAINSACEEPEADLIIVHSEERDSWRCWAVVHAGCIWFYSVISCKTLQLARTDNRLTDGPFKGKYGLTVRY
jgi:hypothetical protein